MNGKSKIVAALLAFFLGQMGVHRYYLGYTKKGVIQTLGFIAFLSGYFMIFGAVAGDISALLFIGLALFLFGCGTGIWAFVDFIRILIGRLKPADGSLYSENRPVQVQMADAPANSVDAIERLAKLRDQGIISEEEFEQKKAELLAKL